MRLDPIEKKAEWWRIGFLILTLLVAYPFLRMLDKELAHRKTESFQVHVAHIFFGAAVVVIATVGGYAVKGYREGRMRQFSRKIGSDS